MSEYVGKYKILTGLSEHIPERIKIAHPEYDFTKFEDSFIFEVSLFMSKDAILTLFRSTREEMDFNCQRVFDNMTFDECYNYYKNMAMQDCKDWFMAFAKDGSTYPQQVVAKFFMGFKDEESVDKTVNIKVIGAVPPEDK